MKFLSKMTILAASLVFAGGVSIFSANVFAQKKTVQTVSIQVQEGMRYISSYGIPRHAAQNYKAMGIQPRSYAFKVNATPEAAGTIRYVKPNEIFGVSLDGVPIKHAVVGFWNNKPEWGMVSKKLDSHGGILIDGDYYYAGVPNGLVSKDLTHVGYAADGFPIFVSKDNKLETSYRLKSGNRDTQTAPPGPHDGQYLSDFRHITRAGVLDECNGIKVKNKFYIYIITADAPHLPLCWKGRPDPTFLKAEVAAGNAEQQEANSRRENSAARRRRR
jgi:hypothetical protein